MMSALPQTPTTLPPAIAALMQALPAGSTGEGGFEQLISTQANAAAPAAPAGEASRMDAPVGNKLRSAPQVDIAIHVEETLDEMQQPTGAKPATKTDITFNDDIATHDDVAATANWLFGVIGRAAAAPAAAAGVGAGAEAGASAETENETKSETASDAADTDTVATVMAWAPTTSPAAATEKPAKDAAPKPTTQGNDDAAARATTPKPREAAQPLPSIALAAAEPKATKPASDPSMTVLFAQPAAGASTGMEIAKPAIIAERVLDMTSDDGWIDQLASDIAATKSATNDISFRLMPRHLGRLDVSMLAGAEGVSVKLDTQHEATAQIVSAAQVRLVDDLRQQGVRVAGAEVTCTPGETGRQSQGQDHAGAQNAAHLIETATVRDEARAEPLGPERATDRRGRFA